MARYVTFEHKQVGPVTLIKPLKADLVSRERINVFSDELLEFVSNEKPPRIVFTLKHVDRYSSEAIGGLIRVDKEVRSYGGEMKLCMSHDVRELFRVTRLDGNVFDIYESESEAVASFFEHGGDIFEEE